MKRVLLEWWGDDSVHENILERVPNNEHQYFELSF